MNKSIENLLIEIQGLERQLQEQLHTQSEKAKYQFKNGKLEFEKEIKARHSAIKVSVARYVSNARWLVIVTAPVIYAIFIPFLILDISVTLYQTICFPVYSIPKVRRRDYFVFDRVKLGYLNGVEKFNCLYCSYGNGVIAYAREVAARTEQYWCPIKHAKPVIGRHKRYHRFANFGDGEQYRKSLRDIQKDFED